MPAVALALDHRESKADAPFAPADAEAVDDEGFPSVDAGVPKEGVDFKPGFEEDEGVDVDGVGARGTEVK